MKKFIFLILAIPLFASNANGQQYHAAAAYDLVGNVKECIREDGDTCRFSKEGKLEYDSQHKHINKVFYDKDGFVVNLEYMEYIYFDFTELVISRLLGYSEEDSYSLKTDSFAYNDAGRLIEYNNSGYMVRFTRNINGDVCGLEEVLLNRRTTYSNYKKDNHGNWVYRVASEDGKRKVETRTITYWENGSSSSTSERKINDANNAAKERVIRARMLEINNAQCNFYGNPQSGYRDISALQFVTKAFGIEDLPIESNMKTTRKAAKKKGLSLDVKKWGEQPYSLVNANSHRIAYKGKPVSYISIEYDFESKSSSFGNPIWQCYEVHFNEEEIKVRPDCAMEFAATFAKELQDAGYEMYIENYSSNGKEKPNFVCHGEYEISKKYSFTNKVCIGKKYIIIRFWKNLVNINIGLKGANVSNIETPNSNRIKFSPRTGVN